jgi:hypothetical protein
LMDGLDSADQINNCCGGQVYTYILGHLGFSITRYSNAAEILRVGRPI